VPEGFAAVPNHSNVAYKKTFPLKWGSEEGVKFSLKPFPKHFSSLTSPKNMLNCSSLPHKTQAASITPVL
jgi:hypothetical protein